jgi:cell division transport system ATP-binding protein
MAPLATRPAPEAQDARRSSGVPVVEFDDVSKVYPGGHVGLEQVSMKIGRGEFVFLVGPTGCGKSTCIRLLMKELEATEGDILISGHSLPEMPRRKVPRLRRNIGVVFQDYKLLPNRTVYDNVAYTLKVTGERRSEIRRKVPEILRLVGLQGKVHNYPDQLSGGEQQRVAIVRALANRPQLLIADEPTGQLDSSNARTIMRVIRELVRTEGVSAIVATHDPLLLDVADRVVELRDGESV